MTQNNWHRMSTEEILDVQKLQPDAGLSEKEALQRLEEYGPNELSEGKHLSLITLFLNQFKDFMVLVLVGAVLISGLLGEYLDAITIVAIIIMNGILGFIQEFRAERSLRALKELSAPTAKVMRDGSFHQLPANRIVPGDLIILESGDRIPADIRFIETNSLYVEESTLTGESVPVNKHAQRISAVEVPLGDLRNLGFMGTMVTRGNAKGVVIRTGMNTEMGKIASLIENTEAMKTPLQNRLEQLGKILIALSIGLTVMVVIAGIMHGQPAYGMFLAGVSLAVAAIPEGLPAIVTIALALGVQRMIKRKAIVRKLPSVETLGCASVICSDKTGTLTQNKMTVTHLWMGGNIFEVSGEGFEPYGEFKLRGLPVDVRKDQTLRRLLQISVLCNNATLHESYPDLKRKKAKDHVKSVWQITGDPTEGALVVLGAKAGVTPASLQGLYQRVNEFPFDSERKRMSVVVEHQGGRLMCTKGAPDVLIQHCSYMLWDGNVVPFTGTLKQKVLAANDSMAKSALRVIGLAYREMKTAERIGEEAADVENNLIFVGLTGMIDPPRKEVRDAIVTCRRAGIRTVMITGDHQATAEAIALQLGMIPKDGLTMNGQQLAALSDEQLDRQIEK
ncbi:MAG TPA: HAD-IC family P-type ATPase, partial [Bacilli bacterium]